MEYVDTGHAARTDRSTLDEDRMQASSSDAGNSSVAAAGERDDADRRRSTPPRLSVSVVDDRDAAVAAAVFNGLQEPKANSWPARTVANLVPDRTRRYSERSTSLNFLLR